jgi:hypothetical protein
MPLPPDAGESGLVNRLANAFRPGAASTSQRRLPRCLAPIRLSAGRVARILKYSAEWFTSCQFH